MQLIIYLLSVVCYANAEQTREYDTCKCLKTHNVSFADGRGKNISIPTVCIEWKCNEHLRDCLSRSDSTVILVNNQEKVVYLDDLKKGDLVLSHYEQDGKRVFSSINYISHYDNSTHKEFVAIKLGNGNYIHLTSKHRIFSSSSEHVVLREMTARELYDDFLHNKKNYLLVNNVLTEVTDVKLTIQRGFTSPITQSGTIIVGSCNANQFVGAYVSSYAAPWYISHYAFKIHNWLTSGKTRHGYEDMSFWEHAIENLAF